MDYNNIFKNFQNFSNLYVIMIICGVVVSGVNKVVIFT